MLFADGRCRMVKLISATIVICRCMQPALIVQARIHKYIPKGMRRNLRVGADETARHLGASVLNGGAVSLIEQLLNKVLCPSPRTICISIRSC